jgi:hypothetical protein
MMLFDFKVVGLKKLQKALKVESTRQRQVLNLAVRVEAFRLMKQLKADLRKGTPGGEPIEPLSVIWRRRRYKGRNRPLSALAVAAGYYVTHRDPIQVGVGFAGPKLSKSWQRIAKQLQQGFTFTPSKSLRRYLAAYGGELKSKTKARQFFFLRKSTTQFKIPARPIIEPFWKANQAQSVKNIRDNFRRKMRGQRI